MNGLIRASLKNPYAVTVFCLTLVMLGSVSVYMIPIDILPVFRSPAVQVLTFYGGMPAVSIEKDITNRMERWTGQANGLLRQESRSIVGASIVRDFFRGGVDPNGALTQVNSLALGVVPNLPPGTLPPVVLPFDPTSTAPVCIVAVDSPDGSQNESILYDVGRYEVRNMLMSLQGAVTPVVYGGKIRAVMAYLDRQKLEARGLSPLDVMTAMDRYNVFLPTGDAKIGNFDYALDSNSMFDFVRDMGDIPLHSKIGNVSYLRDVATPKDSSYIQTNVVRVDGKREVYIPVFRQLGSSTLAVVNSVGSHLDEFTARLTRGGVRLLLVMDQSIFVRQAIMSLVQEGVLGAVLCSLTILLFLGQWRMTAIAVMTLPISVLSACICLYAIGQTINAMTLAGLTLAIGPMIDSAIICLENTHRHLGLGASPHEAAYLGASEVALPELVSTLCTFLVLAPLALMPGMGEFLFQPLTFAVAFAMCSAYILSRTLVPACSAAWLSGHTADHGHDAAHGTDETAPNGFNGHGHGKRPNAIARGFAWWEKKVDAMFASYATLLAVVLRHRLLTIGIGFGSLAVILAMFWPNMRREFYPDVDGGAFEMYARAPSGTRIEKTEEMVAEVEQMIKKTIPHGYDLRLIASASGVDAIPTSGKGVVIIAKVKDDLHFRIFDETGKRVGDSDETQLKAQSKSIEELKEELVGMWPPHPVTPVEQEEMTEKVASMFGHKPPPHDLEMFISEIGVNADWSAAYTPNAGPMDAVIKVQLSEHRTKSAQEYVHMVRTNLANDPRFNTMDFSFDAGGLVRSAMNEGKSTPINVRVTGKNRETNRAIADRIRAKVVKVKGVVDARIIQRLDYPEYVIDVNRAKAADLGLTQEDVMRNVVAAFNSSIQFNKKNFWIDPIGGNQYFVGVQYPEGDIKSIETLLNIPITGSDQIKAIPLGNLISLRRTTVPTESTHQNIQPTIDLTMGVYDRDLGHISEDVTRIINGFGVPEGDGVWRPYDPASSRKQPMKGSKIVLSGEYSKMQDTFRDLGFGLIGASVLIYFLMVGLDKSWVVPFTVMSILPLCLVGILPALYFSGTAVNVQSLLGFIFVIGIKVANTVLMTDFAQELRHAEGLTPTQAIFKSASIRVKPVTMTAVAAFFALIPGALALERGSEANAPLARAILGGLLAGEPATLFVLPCIYSLLVRDRPGHGPGDHREGDDETPSAGEGDELDNDPDDRTQPETF